MKLKAMILCCYYRGIRMEQFLLEKISGIYEHLDSVMITNKYGVIEYSALFDQNSKTINNVGYTGHNILDVYPELTEETSSHYRVMKTGEPIINEVQELVDWEGKSITLMSSTYPIEIKGVIIGAIEGTLYLTKDGEPYRRYENHDFKKLSKQNRLYNVDDIITNDPEMIEIKKKILRVAEGESFAIIVGATGTGKELVAQSLHSHSKRAAKPFISQNCAAIPAGLLESMIFGTVKGSYTGAEDKKGLLELADGGTLFLDELNSMDIGIQSKILKAIETQKIRRLGEEIERPIDVRIISALNEEPFEAIKEGKLREDLYYRLSVVQFNLPRLAKRKNDIEPLIEYYIDYFNKVTGKNIKGCSDIVMNSFMRYCWPGNIRELRNAIEYAFNMVTKDEITLADIPENIFNNGRLIKTSLENSIPGIELLERGMSLTNVVNEYEKKLIQNALQNNRTITDASRSLNISRQALNYKMEKYNLAK